MYGIDDSCDVAPYNPGVINVTSCIVEYQDGWEKTCAIGVAKLGTADGHCQWETT